MIKPAIKMNKESEFGTFGSKNHVSAQTSLK